MKLDKQEIIELIYQSIPNANGLEIIDSEFVNDVCFDWNGIRFSVFPSGKVYEYERESGEYRHVVEYDESYYAQLIEKLLADRYINRTVRYGFEICS